MLRQFCEIKTATMRGRPLSKYDNRDIWNFVDIEYFKLNGEAYKSIDYKNLYYLTDTGRTWSETSANLRDNAFNSIPIPSNLRSTDDLKSFFTLNDGSSIAIVFHPERWSSNYFHLLLQIFIDFVSSTIKKTLKILR